jgi:predicted permease
VTENLKASAAGVTQSWPQSRFRHALAVGQVALAFVLLLGMALCARSYSATRKMDLGFDPSGVWLAGFRLNPPANTNETVRKFFRDLQTEVINLPGVESAALSSYIPLGIEGIDLSGVRVPGYIPSPGETVNAGIEVVSPGYFKTLRVQLLAGREFADSDDPSTPMVAIVNEAFARKYFAGRNAVGLTFDTGRGEARIVGVARTGKYRSLGEAALPYFYLCAWQHLEHNLTLAIRTKGQPSQVSAALVRLAVSLDPDAPPHATMSGEDYVRAAFVVPRVAGTLLSFLGSVAVLLALIGMYAVVSHNVSQRIREFGVRLALGARPSNVLWLVLRHGLLLIGIGLLIGAVLGSLVSLLIASVLAGISATDPTTWLSVSLILLTAVLAACWLPVQRALRSNPLQLLRYE